MNAVRTPDWCRRSSLRRLATSGLTALSLVSAAARADAPDSIPTLNLYGSPGLLDMPGGHMSPDGSLNIWASGTGFTQRYGFSFQALPWFEGSFRYIGTKNLFNASQVFSGGTYYDRSFGMRIRLQNETGGWPDITMGINDIIGTGIEGTEYFAASKHLGDFDATMGIGWGRLAGTALFENPFALLLSSFAYRQLPTGLVATSGQVNFGTFFHGKNASIFGGVAWRTPVEGLTALLEYSSDNYSLERQQHVFTPATQINFGLSYQATPSIQVGAAIMYGRTPMVRIAATLDPRTDPYPARVGAAPIAPNVRSADALKRSRQENYVVGADTAQFVEARGDTMIAVDPGVVTKGCGRYAALIRSARDSGFREVAISGTDDPQGRVSLCPTADTAWAGQRVAQNSSWNDANSDSEMAALARIRAHIVELATAQGLEIDALNIHGSQANVAFTNIHYRTEPEAYGRLARVLMAAMPDEVETFRIISLADGAPTRELVVPRSSLERIVGERGGGGELLPLVLTDQTSAPAAKISPSLVDYPNFDWALLPEFNQSLFDPNKPYQFQVAAGASGGMNLTRQIRFEGEVQASLYNDFSLLPSDSQLPHVRSDFPLYFEKGKDGIAEFQGSYTTTLAPGVFALARAGILENMFAGGGGEILWRPEAVRWALGATLYEVWQRGFDRLFDLRAYHVLAGHLSAYYESPWDGLDFEVDAGRYLAGDTGATLTISRRFDTGVEIGVFATITNVPFSKFGEGAFDKGFVFKIPVDFMVPVESQSEFDLNLRPVTRDGGQMLDPEQVLYDTIRRTSYGDFLTHVDQIPAP